MLAIRQGIAAASLTTAALPVASGPVTWDILGVQLDAGPTTVGLCAVAITRTILYLQSKDNKQFALDFFVSLLCALSTVVWIHEQKSSLGGAFAWGVGFASLGIGVITIIRGQVASRLKKAGGVLFGGEGDDDGGDEPPHHPHRPRPHMRGHVERETPPDMLEALDRIDAAEAAPVMSRPAVTARRTLPLSNDPADNDPYGD